MGRKEILRRKMVISGPLIEVVIYVHREKGIRKNPPISSSIDDSDQATDILQCMDVQEQSQKEDPPSIPNSHV